MKSFLIGIAALAFVFFIIWSGRNFESDRLTIGGKTIRVWLADDPAEQAKGLSDKKSMPANRGMLFVLAVKNQTPFWMKDMKFSLDFIWIADSTIVGIDQNVQPCKDDSNCPSIYPPQAVNYVLEMNSGWSGTNNIQVGQTVYGLPK